MQINFVFPAYDTPVKGQVVDVRAHVDSFDRLSRRFQTHQSLDMCGEVTDIQPHSDPDLRVVTVSVTSEL